MRICRPLCNKRYSCCCLSIFVHLINACREVKREETRPDDERNISLAPLNKTQAFDLEKACSRPNQRAFHILFFSAPPHALIFSQNETGGNKKVFPETCYMTDRREIRDEREQWRSFKEPLVTKKEREPFEKEKDFEMPDAFLCVRATCCENNAWVWQTFSLLLQRNHTSVRAKPRPTDANFVCKVCVRFRWIFLVELTLVCVLSSPNRRLRSQSCWAYSENPFCILRENEEEGAKKLRAFRQSRPLEVKGCVIFVVQSCVILAELGSTPIKD